MQRKVILMVNSEPLLRRNFFKNSFYRKAAKNEKSKIIFNEQEGNVVCWDFCRLLLEFWKTHYLKRGKDCSALEQVRFLHLFWLCYYLVLCLGDIFIEWPAW